MMDDPPPATAPIRILVEATILSAVIVPNVAVAPCVVSLLKTTFPANLEVPVTSKELAVNPARVDTPDTVSAPTIVLLVDTYDE